MRRSDTKIRGAHVARRLRQFFLVSACLVLAFSGLFYADATRRNSNANIGFRLSPEFMMSLKDSLVDRVLEIDTPFVLPIPVCGDMRVHGVFKNLMVSDISVEFERVDEVSSIVTAGIEFSHLNIEKPFHIEGGLQETVTSGCSRIRQTFIGGGDDNDAPLEILTLNGPKLEFEADLDESALRLDNIEVDLDPGDLELTPKKQQRFLQGLLKTLRSVPQIQEFFYGAIEKGFNDQLAQASQDSFLVFLNAFSLTLADDGIFKSRIGDNGVEMQTMASLNFEGSDLFRKYECSKVMLPDNVAKDQRHQIIESRGGRRIHFATQGNNSHFQGAISDEFLNDVMFNVAKSRMGCFRFAGDLAWIVSSLKPGMNPGEVTPKMILAPRPPLLTLESGADASPLLRSQWGQWPIEIGIHFDHRDISLNRFNMEANFDIGYKAVAKGDTFAIEPEILNAHPALNVEFARLSPGVSSNTKLPRELKDLFQSMTPGLLEALPRFELPRRFPIESEYFGNVEVYVDDLTVDDGVLYVGLSIDNLNEAVSQAIHYLRQQLLGALQDNDAEITTAEVNR